MKRTLLLAMLVTLAAPAGAGDVRQVEVSGPRVTLGEVLPGAPAGARAADLGAVPSPGGSRVIGRDELARALPEDSHVRVPDAVRVVRKMQRLGATELARVGRAAVLASVADGVTLEALHAPPSTSVAAGWTRVTATMPKLPHRVGRTSVTALLDFRRDAEVLQSVSVRVDLDVSERAARPDVVHGSTISAVLTRGLVEITASATASADGDVGDVIPVSVRSTGRTLRARIVAKDRAVIVEAP